MGVSRSVLAERFAEIVGQPPMQYLALWRMQLASRLLLNGGAVAAVASAVGYESEAAFSRAFSSSWARLRRRGAEVPRPRRARSRPSRTGAPPAGRCARRATPARRLAARAAARITASVPPKVTGSPARTPMRRFPRPPRVAAYATTSAKAAPTEAVTRVWANHHAQHVRGPRAHGYADAELLRPLRDRIRHDAVHADGGQREGQESEGGEQAGGHAGAHSAWSKSWRMVMTLVIGMRASSDCTCPRTVPRAAPVTAAGADVQGDRLRRVLGERQVEERLRVLADRDVFGIAGHAHHLDDPILA